MTFILIHIIANQLKYKFQLWMTNIDRDSYTSESKGDLNDALIVEQ